MREWGGEQPEENRRETDPVQWHEPDTVRRKNQQAGEKKKAQRTRQRKIDEVVRPRHRRSEQSGESEKQKRHPERRGLPREQRRARPQPALRPLLPTLPNEQAENERSKKSVREIGVGLPRRPEFDAADEEEAEHASAARQHERRRGEKSAAQRLARNCGLINGPASHEPDRRRGGRGGKTQSRSCLTLNQRYWSHRVCPNLRSKHAVTYLLNQHA